MGKFEKQNRPVSQSGASPQRSRSPQQSGSSPRGSSSSRQPGASSRRSSSDQQSSHRRSSSSGKKNSFLLPAILGALVIGVGIVAGLLCVKFFGKNNDPEKNLIREDLYIAGVNVGGLEKEAALNLLMQTYPPQTPPGTTPDGEQEQVLSQIYTTDNMNIHLYTTPEELVLYQSTYDPSQEIPVDIYGKPMETEPTESAPEGDTSSESQSSETTEPETSETTEATEETNTPDSSAQDAPLTPDGKPYLPDQVIVLPPSQVNLTLNLSAAVDAAYTVGREGGPESEDGPMTLDLAPYLTYDEAYIRDVLNSTYESTLQEGSQTTVEKSTTTIMDAEGKESQVDCLNITFGTMSRKLDTQALFAQILSAYNQGKFDLTATYQEELPTALDLDELYETYECKMPVNAVCDPETFKITPEAKGYGFLMKDAIALAENAKPGDQIILTLTELEPQHTKKDLETTLFRDILGSCISPHVYNPTRTHNLELAAQAINGTILLPGEEFSFNRIVGERTAEKGYGEAGVYVGGRTENQLGGGVCQVASAIYYSCLKADLKITERYEHQYTPTYVPWGMDATIYWGSLDYRFVNNTAYPIRIDASVHDGSVYVDLVGTETRDYTVKLDYSIISTDPSTQVTVYIHPDMQGYSNYSGYKNGEVIQTAYDGYTVKTYMYKYDLNDNLIDTILVNTSKYDRRDREVAQVLDPSKPMKEQIEEIENPTEPTEPTTEPTEPPTEPTEPPTEPTEPPTEPTEPTTAPTEPPTEPTTEPTEPPTEATEPPTEATDPPTEASETPAE